MDPIGASCLSFHIQENDEAILKERQLDEEFNQIIASSKSLSTFERRSFKTSLPQVLAALAAASYHIIAGLSSAYSGILIPALDRNVTNDNFDDDIRATKNECAWIASIVVVVVPIGALIGGFITDTLGRLNTLKLATIPSIVGWFLIASANSVFMIIVGRVVVGFGTAWMTVPATVYITEISRADLRGALVSFAPTIASAGMLLCFLEGWFLHWRTVAWLANAFSVLALIPLFFIPESPVWLISKDRIQEAAASLKWIHKYQPQPQNRSESMAELHLNHMQKEHQAKLLEKAKNDGSKFREFLKPTGYKPFLIITGIFLFQQFSGIYVILFYSVTFFSEIGTSLNPYLASVLIALVRMLMSCANTYMLRIFRRRPLIIASGLGMALSMGLAGLFTKWIKEGTSDQTWIPAILILCYVVTSMVGLLPIPWTMTAELFSVDIRGVANSASYSIANLIMFAAIQSFWTMFDVFGGIAGVQWFFAFTAICSSAFTFVFMPETHRKKLSEIAGYFIHNTIFLGSSKGSRPSREVVSRRIGPRRSIVLNGEQREKLMESA